MDPCQVRLVCIVGSVNVRVEWWNASSAIRIDWFGGKSFPEYFEHQDWPFGRSQLECFLVRQFVVTCSWSISDLYRREGECTDCCVLVVLGQEFIDVGSNRSLVEVVLDLVNSRSFLMISKVSVQIVETIKSD